MRWVNGKTLKVISDEDLINDIGLHGLYSDDILIQSKPKNKRKLKQGQQEETVFSAYRRVLSLKGPSIASFRPTTPTVVENFP